MIPIGLKGVTSVWRASLLVMFFIATLFVILRLAARIKRSEIRASDYLLGFTWVLSLLYLTVSMTVTGSRLGILLPPGLTQKSLAKVIAAERAHALLFLTTPCITVPLAKMSMILLLLEIDYDRTRILVLRSLFLLSAVQGVTLTLFAMFTCGRTSYSESWSLLTSITMESESPICVSPLATVFLRTIVTGLIELGVFVVSLKLVSLLRVCRWQKIGLFSAFSIGIILCIADILGACFEYSAYETFMKTPLPAARRFFVGRICVSVEIYLGILLAAILPIRAQTLEFLHRGLHAIGLCRKESKEVPEDANSSPSTTPSGSISSSVAKVDIESYILQAAITKLDLEKAVLSGSVRDMSEPQIGLPRNLSCVDSLILDDEALKSKKAELYAV